MAAESLGIGSCYIGDVMENFEGMRELLHLPDYVFPASMLVFGYPTKQQLDWEKPKRAPYEGIVYQNQYSSLTQENLHTLIDYKTNGNFNEWLTGFCNRKYNSLFSIEMSRSVREYLKQYNWIR